MTAYYLNPKHKRIWTRAAGLAVAGFAAAIAAGGGAGAASSRHERPVESIDWRAAGEPVMAIVSLRSQRITIYDARGLMAQAPVSSGQKGRETPAGIFSVLQKDADHYSNLYDDAYMPHMQRLTWSGIALHGGPLPGYPASHGCVRMPFDFARNLFDATRLGMRVIVVPADVAPVEIAHPALFQPMKSDTDFVAAARNAEAQEATGKADQARLAAVTASQEAARATIAVRVAQNLKLRARRAISRAHRTSGPSMPYRSPVPGAYVCGPPAKPTWPEALPVARREMLDPSRTRRSASTNIASSRFEYGLPRILTRG